MNKERVLQAIDNLKGSLETMDYGRWGALNVEQRRFIKELCNSWLILDKATNIQTKEIERLENIIKEVRKYIEKEYVQVKNKEYNLSWNNLEYIIKEILEILDKGSDEISK